MALNVKQEKKLLTSALFSGCDEKRYHVYAQTLTPVNMIKGQLLTQKQERPKIGLLLDGNIDVCTHNGVLIMTISSGEYFEIDPLYSNIRPELPIYMRARSAGSMTFINKEDLTKLIQSDHVIAMNYIGLLSDQLQGLVCRFVQVTAPTPSTALGLYLLRTERGHEVRLQNGLAGLARRLNVSRATLYRALADLEETGLVMHHEKILYIKDPRKLRRYCMEQSEMNPLLEPARKNDKSKGS